MTEAQVIEGQGDFNPETPNTASLNAQPNLGVQQSSGPRNSEGQHDESQNEPTWNRCLNLIESQLDPQIFAAYLRPLKLGSVDRASSLLIISAPSRLVLNHIDLNYRGLIERIARDAFSMPELSLRLEVDTQRVEQNISRVVKVRRPQVIPPAPESVQKSAGSSANSSVHSSNLTNVNTRYTFDSFVVGNSNQFCHAAAMRAAEEPGKSYNPLFIYGGVGLGKTHLLHAIGNSVLSRKPGSKVLYMSSETFTNELIQALRNAKMDEFKTRLRSIEVLLIDDIQFIVGKERTQEEFFHTFNALYSAHHQIVITSDKIPQDIPGIEERLQTRFSWGLTADLQSPDFETRVAIIKRKASADGLSLPEEVAHFIAEKVSSNVRELEGALTRLHAISSLQRSSVSMELAKNALKPFLQRKAVNITSEDIKRAVAQHFGVKTSEMISKRRTKSISFPRHVAMYLCRKHTTLSYPEIGGEFGGRDHSSVIHAAQVVSTKLSNDPTVKNLIVEIEKELLG